MINNKKSKRIKTIFSVMLFSFCLFGVFSVVKNTNGKKLGDFKPYSYFSDESEFEGIWPLFGHPITDFDIKLKTFKDGKEEINFERKDEIDIQGEFNFLFNEKRMNELIKDCTDKTQKNCDSESWSDKKCSEVIHNLCQDSTGYTVDFIEDLGVYAQIWRKDESENAKGDYFIDEFYIAENIDAKVGDTKEFKSSWKVPEEIPEGSYYISIFINSSNSFNIKGYPSIVGVKAASYSFKIVPGEKKGIQLDKENIKLNGIDFSYLNLIAPMVDDKNLKVEVPLANLDSGNKKVDVTYELFKWSQEDPANSLKKKQESVDVAGGGKVNLVYEENLDDSQIGAYILVITATDGKSISKSFLRFGLRGDNRGVMLFLGVAKSPEGLYYPMVCPRNAQREGKFSAKFKIELLDKNNKEIAVFEEDGFISPVVKCFLFDGRNFKLNGLNYVKLRGTITGEGGNINDQREIEYDFTREGYESVLKSLSLSKTEVESFITSKKGLGILVTVIILLILGVFSVSISSKRKKEDKNKIVK